MVTYNINDLEEITGIKAHTIRIWEKRYNIIVPKRTETNIRYYDENDLKKFLLISILYHNDIKISEIAELSDKKLKENVLLLNKINEKYENQIQSLLIAINELDEQKFNNIFQTIIMTLSFEKAFAEIFYPLFLIVDTLNLTNSISKAKQNFYYLLIEQKINTTINSLIYKKNKPAERFILFASENKINYILLLYFQYYLKKRNFEVINLGTGINIKDIREVLQIKSATNILTIGYGQKHHIEELKINLNFHFPKHNILIYNKEKNLNDFLDFQFYVVPKNKQQQ